MNYEIVHLKEKIVAGITIRTNNSNPNMSKVIGETWQKFLFTFQLIRRILSRN